MQSKQKSDLPDRMDCGLGLNRGLTTATVRKCTERYRSGAFQAGGASRNRACFLAAKSSSWPRHCRCDRRSGGQRRQSPIPDSMNRGMVAKSQRQLRSRFPAEFAPCSKSMTMPWRQSRSWISSHVIISLGSSTGISVTGAITSQFRETHPCAIENFEVMAPVTENKNLMVHEGKRLRTVVSNGP
jgi:hypothetical protein